MNRWPFICQHFPLSNFCAIQYVDQCMYYVDQCMYYVDRYSVCIMLISVYILC